MSIFFSITITGRTKIYVQWIKINWYRCVWTEIERYMYDVVKRIQMFEFRQNSTREKRNLMVTRIDYWLEVKQLRSVAWVSSICLYTGIFIGESAGLSRNVFKRGLKLWLEYGTKQIIHLSILTMILLSSKDKRLRHPNTLPSSQD